MSRGNGPGAFRVWAPSAGHAPVDVGGTSHPMTRTSGGDGWWEAFVSGAGHGEDYAFRIDGGDARPDPRSLWQPQGVHGPSRTYDHTRFAWHDQEWRGHILPGSVLYEMHIGTFSTEGTFDGAIERLDHLVALGVDAVELLPLASFDGPHGWGYDGVDLYAVHEPYGGPDGLKRFVDACHQRGIGVVLDVVYNHLGPSRAYLHRFGPYFAGSTIWGPSLNLDGAHSEEVRRYVIDNAKMWLEEFHV